MQPDQIQAQEQPHPADELINRLGKKVGDLETQKSFAEIRLQRAQQRVQKLEAELEELRGVVEAQQDEDDQEEED